MKGKMSVFHILKRSFDVVISLLVMVILFPLCVVVALAIKLEDGGYVIHKRLCVGRENTHYIMYKFRSMKTNADDIESLLSAEQMEEYKRECKLINDPRITKVGRFIRRFSIDELPQLVNVFKGNMSLIGPRPIVDFEKQFWGENLDKILEVKPGITGYWQIHGRSDATYASGRRQMYEMYYVEHQSIKLDIHILLGTVKAVLGGKGAR